MSKATKELRRMDFSSLQAKIPELQKELVKLRGQASTGTPPKNPLQIKTSKRTIARIKTVLREKELVVSKEEVRIKHE
jgi:large subunit ribosomal protein L29